MMELPATFQEFEARARSEGYDEILVRVWDPGQVNAEHTHPFAVDAIVVAGRVALTVDGVTRQLGAGDVFRIAAGQAHAEHYGPEGATFWVARRHAAAAG